MIKIQQLTFMPASRIRLTLGKWQSTVQEILMHVDDHKIGKQGLSQIGFQPAIQKHKLFLFQKKKLIKNKKTKKKKQNVLYSQAQSKKYIKIQNCGRLHNRVERTKELVRFTKLSNYNVIRVKNTQHIQWLQIVVSCNFCQTVQA